MKQLIEEQEKEFERSELCKRITTTEMYAINHGFPEWKGESVMDWHKQSLKQFIDGLIEREEKDRKWHKEFECNAAFNGKGCFETFCEDQNCRNAPKEWNQSKDSTISHLKEIKEELN